MIETEHFAAQGRRLAALSADAHGRSVLLANEYVGPGAVAALFAVVYYSTIVKLVKYWTANDTYSFGFFIPLLAMVMVWKNLDQLRNARWSPSLFAGSLVTTCGLGLLLAGRVSATNIVEELSLVLTIWGLTLLLFGRRVFTILLFPLAYLLAMVPIGEPLLARLHPYFQLYSTNVGVRLLRLFDIPVFSEGTFIYLPSIRLEVAQTCSGVNYLVAVICVGLAVGYVFIRSWSKRAFVIAAAAIIALLSNALRVAMVAAFAYYGVRGEDGDIHGPFAFARTLLVSGVGYIALFALTARLADRSASSGNPHDAGKFAAVPHGGTSWGSALVAVVLLGSALVFGRAWQITDAPLNVPLSAAIPQQIGQWESRQWGVVAAKVPPFGFDDRLQRYYVTPHGDELSLFVGYLNRQIQGRELVGYDVHHALGVDSAHSAVRVSGIEVPDLVVIEGSTSYHVFYWYVVDRHAFGRDAEAKLYVAWRGIVHRQNNGALVVVRTRADVGELTGESLERVRDFLAEIVPLSTRVLTTPQRRM